MYHVSLHRMYDATHLFLHYRSRNTSSKMVDGATAKMKADFIARKLVDDCTIPSGMDISTKRWD